MMKKALLTAVVLGSVITCNYVSAAPIDKIDSNLDAGVQMNRTREYLKREMLAAQLAEERANANKSKVEGQQGTAQDQEAPAVTFKLNKLDIDKSEVLSPEEIKGVTSSYEGKEVSVKDLYAAVAKINEIYNNKGFITCRAFLTAQTIKDGIVKITLVEGKTGNTTIINNKTTKERYITRRVGLNPGKPANIKEVNKDLLRFNATNDAQLRIVMKAGEKPGTTDYVLQVYEPKQHNFNLFMDNAGSYSSGDTRVGLFYTVKSLSGNRDSLTLGTIRSEGTKAGSASYSRSVGRSGAKLNTSISSNSVRQVRMDADSHVKGHAKSLALEYVQPWIINEKVRSEVSLDYGYQNSKSDMLTGADRFTIVNDTLNDVTVAFAMTNYGKSHIIYQKHGYTVGRSKSSPDALYFTPESNNYGFYKFNGLYQKTYAHGQMISSRLEGQWSSNDNMVSSRQHYIGGFYSVRGYKENYMGGDSGFTFSAEYSLPILKNHKADAYCFFDYGHVYGESAESNGKDRILSSLGLGIRATILKNCYANVSIGFPLRREFSAKQEEVSKTRINFIVSGQF